MQGLVTPTWEDLSPRVPGFSILRRLGRPGAGGERRGSREAAPLAGHSLLFSNPCLRTSGPPGAPSHRLRLRRAKSMCVTQAQGLRTQGRPSLKCPHSAVCRRGIGFKVPGRGATDSKVPFGVLPGVKYSGLPLPFFLSTSQHRSRKHPCSQHRRGPRQARSFPDSTAHGPPADPSERGSGCRIARCVKRCALLTRVFLKSFFKICHMK